MALALVVTQCKVFRDLVLVYSPEFIRISNVHFLLNTASMFSNYLPKRPVDERKSISVIMYSLVMKNRECLYAVHVNTKTGSIMYLSRTKFHCFSDSSATQAIKNEENFEHFSR